MSSKLSKALDLLSDQWINEAAGYSVHMELRVTVVKDGDIHLRTTRSVDVETGDGDFAETAICAIRDVLEDDGQEELDAFCEDEED